MEADARVASRRLQRGALTQWSQRPFHGVRGPAFVARFGPSRFPNRGSLSGPRADRRARGVDLLGRRGIRLDCLGVAALRRAVGGGGQAPTRVKWDREGISVPSRLSSRDRPDLAAFEGGTAYLRRSLRDPRC